MADTVKKSRIVSEEDTLEESLLEEFNLRLKKCMSQDNLNSEEDKSEPSIYENIPAEQLIGKSKDASSDFIKMESEHYYEEPIAIIKNGTNTNGYEKVEHQQIKTEEITIEPDQSIDDEDAETEVHQEAPPSIQIHTGEEETKDVKEEEEEEPHYEVPRSLNIKFVSDFSEADSKSVKDRMFLSTDDASCLLFTQTVTSPMLTPSEENIDFLKGFRGDSPPDTTTKPKSEENLYENVVKNGNSEFESENIYENLDEIKAHEISNELVQDFNENEDVPENEEVIYQNVVELRSDAQNNNDEISAPKASVDVVAVESQEPKIAGEIVAKEKYSELISHTRSETNSNYYEKYTEVLSKSQSKMGEANREKDTETVPAEIVKNLKSQFSKGDVVATKKEINVDLKTIDIMKQINKFEQNEQASEEAVEEDSTEISETYVETIETHSNGVVKGSKKKKSKKSRKEEKENISVKSSFSKFDALQKKNVLHVRSSDSSKAQEKFNGAQVDTTNCKACAKQVFQMEQIKAEKAVWHKNCFRCTECNKNLTVDTYQSHEGSLYCKPHFKAIFAPKAVEDETPQKPRKPELIIRENQPLELPPDVVRASDKPDLGLEELQSLNVKERFQVFEHHQTESDNEKGFTPINVKRSPSILSKVARFQAKGMDVGVADESLNGIPIDESSSDEEVEEEETEGGEVDVDLIRAKRVQKEKPFHFTGMSDVKNKWEHGEQSSRDERREERKQEIQSIRNRLFMGKQGKMKEAYQQAVMESESCTNLLKMSEKIESCDTKSLKERFEKGELANDSQIRDKDEEEMEVYESEISKKSRSLFLELDANASKAPQISPVSPAKLDVKKAREAFLAKVSSEDTIKSSETVDDVSVKTADIQQRFKFFETYKAPEKQRKQFRITPPREGQVKAETPDREIYRDPEVVRAEEYVVEDSGVAKKAHTATKMLNKFRQMEEDLTREPDNTGPKPLKCFTPPPEPARIESNSDDEESGSEEESGEEEEDEDEADHARLPDDLIEAQKAARAKQLRAKFERWEANEIKREQNNSSINIAEECGEDQSQIESTKSLRARFESMRESSSDKSRTPRVKVNRFVEIPSVTETCHSCNSRVYPLEKIAVHGLIFHKKCFKCMECSCILRMDSYSFNQGLLYCTPHFKRLFISKGNYDTGFGLGQHKEKWCSNPNNATIC